MLLDISFQFRKQQWILTLILSSWTSCKAQGEDNDFFIHSLLLIDSFSRQMCADWPGQTLLVSGVQVITAPSAPQHQQPVSVAQHSCSTGASPGSWNALRWGDTWEQGGCSWPQTLSNVAGVAMPRCTTWWRRPRRIGWRAFSSVKPVNICTWYVCAPHCQGTARKWHRRGQEVLNY